MARKLKKYVIPSIIGTVALSSVIGIPLYLKETKPVDSNYKFTIKEDDSKKIFPVINEVEENKPLKPFLEETVGKSKDYYNRSDDEATQNNSLIYFEKTYMPSTGILYSSDEAFDIIAVQDGTVSKVDEDNILGKYIEIEHDNGYKTTYYSLSETTVTKGSSVTKGDVIGVSGTNKIDGTSTNNLLFESYQNGYLLDPEDFYNVDFSSKSN